MRTTVSTSRSWKGYHEAKRSELENFFQPDVLATLVRQLKEFRAELRQRGRQARAFLRARHSRQTLNLDPQYSTLKLFGFL